MSRILKSYNAVIQLNCFVCGRKLNGKSRLSFYSSYGFVSASLSKWFGNRDDPWELGEISSAIYCEVVESHEKKNKPAANKSIHVKLLFFLYKCKFKGELQQTSEYTDKKK